MIVHANRHPAVWGGHRVPRGRVQLARVALAPHEGARLLMGGLVREGRYVDLRGSRIGAHTSVGAGKSPNGPAGWFDGAASGIALPDEALWDQASITVLCGFTPAALAGNGALVARWDDVGVNKRVWALWVNATGDLTFDASENGNFNSAFRARLTGAISVGRRYVAVGKAGGSVTTTVAVHEASAASTSALTSLFSTDIGVEFGSAEFGGASRVFFNGAIDFVFVWAGRLPTYLSEILAHEPERLIEPVAPPLSRMATAAGGGGGVGWGPLLAGRRNRLVA